jgi:hypothetical protein
MRKFLRIFGLALADDLDAARHVSKIHQAHLAEANNALTSRDTTIYAKTSEICDLHRTIEDLEAACDNAALENGRLQGISQELTARVVHAELQQYAAQKGEEIVNIQLAEITKERDGLKAEILRLKPAKTKRKR